MYIYIYKYIYISLGHDELTIEKKRYRLKHHIVYIRMDADWVSLCPSYTDSSREVLGSVIYLRDK